MGGQRSAALKVGLLGAYFGRGLMLVLASFVIRNRYLKFLGAAYLIKLAFESLSEMEAGEEEGETRAMSVRGKGFWSIVIAVELADLAFSLDNAVAVVALSNNLYIVMFGVFIGILTMRFAAPLFTLMILVQPALIGWEAKQRKVELLIERAFNGDELVRRMKGWITADPAKVIETVSRFGRLKVLDDKELVIEFEKTEDFQNLQKALQEAFGNEVEAELIRKK